MDDSRYIVYLLLFIFALNKPTILFEEDKSSMIVDYATIANPCASGFQAGGPSYFGDPIDCKMAPVFPDDFHRIKFALCAKTSNDVHIYFWFFHRVHLKFTSHSRIYEELNLSLTV